MPNTLEFHPGHDYFFISQLESKRSVKEDTKDGSKDITKDGSKDITKDGFKDITKENFCSSHNMKVMFKVLDNDNAVREVIGDYQQ